MIDAASQGEKPLITIRNIRFNLLRRHSRIECGYYNNRDIHLRKQVYRHADHCRYTHDNYDQAHHEYKERIFNCKRGHYLSPACLGIEMDSNLGVTRCPT